MTVLRTSPREGELIPITPDTLALDQRRSPGAQIDPSVEVMV